MTEIFQFYKYQDLIGYDLFYVKGKTIEQLKEICLSNSRCVAFNSLGYMKYYVGNENSFKVLPQFNTEVDGLYVVIDRLDKINKINKNKSYTSFADYKFYPNLDSTGNDLYVNTTLSIEQLKELSDKDPFIKGFNTIGYLKTKIEPESKFIPIRKELYSEGLYVKKGEGLYNEGLYNKIKVKMLCNWCDSATLCREWNHMSKGNFTWNNIEITSLNADFYVIINKPCNNEYYDPLRTIIFHMEPWCSDPKQSWGVKTWGPWAEPDESKFLQVRNHKKFLNNCFWQLSLTYNELKNNTFTNKKTKGIRISTICSSKYFDSGHIKRIDFLKFVESKNDPLVQIDIYNIDNQHKFKNYVSPLNKKDVGMLPYKYYFMAENNEENNFITEKLWEPLITDTLCFYWGCPNVSEYIDPRAYVLLDLNDFEKSFNIIKNAIINNLWEQQIEYIRREKQKVLEYYNFFPTIERILLQDLQLNNNMSNNEVQYHKYFKDILNKKVNNICFFHNCSLDKGPSILLEYLEKILVSGALDSLDYLYIINLGKEIKISLCDKIKIINYSQDVQLFEIPTINLIHLFSQFNENTKILYLHSKGITHTNTLQNVKDWANYMMYFLIDNHKICLDLLDYYDTVGCNYHNNPERHYSGNFWWTKSSYIKTLKPIEQDQIMKWGRHTAEWWLLSNNNVKNFVLYNSEVNHYQEPFPKELYDNKFLSKLYEFDNMTRIKCINLERRPDRKEKITKLLDKVHLLEYCDFLKAVDGKELKCTPEIIQLFINNDFGNRRSFIGCALSHYNLWKELINDNKYNNYLILEDDIKLYNSSIKMGINKIFDMLNNDIIEWDIIYLGHTIKNLETYNKLYGQNKEFKLIPHLTNLTIGGIFGYLISKSGATKLLDYINKNGIKHGIDYLMFNIEMNIKHYETVPLLILSDSEDSDIQNNYNALF